MQSCAISDIDLSKSSRKILIGQYPGILTFQEVSEDSTHLLIQTLLSRLVTMSSLQKQIKKSKVYIQSSSKIHRSFKIMNIATISVHVFNKNVSQVLFQGLLPLFMFQQKHKELSTFNKRASDASDQSRETCSKM